jgi:hypothetical protein
MRRRLRLLVDALNPLRLAGRVSRPGPPEVSVVTEQRSADEAKRRLDETRSRLKREHPPVEDG